MLKTEPQSCGPLQCPYCWRSHDHDEPRITDRCDTGHPRSLAGTRQLDRFPGRVGAEDVERVDHREIRWSATGRNRQGRHPVGTKEKNRRVTQAAQNRGRTTRRSRQFRSAQTMGQRMGIADANLPTTPAPLAEDDPAPYRQTPSGELAPIQEVERESQRTA